MDLRRLTTKRLRRLYLEVLGHSPGPSISQDRDMMIYVIGATLKPSYVPLSDIPWGKVNKTRFNSLKYLIKSPRARRKLTVNEVLCVRFMYKQGYTYKTVARQFGCSITFIKHIIDRDLYADIVEEDD